MKRTRWFSWQQMIAVGLAGVSAFGPGCTAAPGSDINESSDSMLPGVPRVMAQVLVDTICFHPGTDSEGTLRLLPVCNVRRGGTFAVSAVSLTGSESGWVHAVPLTEDADPQVQDKPTVASGFWLRSADVALVAVDDDSGALSVSEARLKIAGRRMEGSAFSRPLGTGLYLNILEARQHYRVNADGTLIAVERSGNGDLLVGASPDHLHSDRLWTVRGVDGFLVANDDVDNEAMCSANWEACEQVGQYMVNGVSLKAIGGGLAVVLGLVFGFWQLIKWSMPKNATVRVQNTTQIEPATSLYAVTPFSGGAGQGGAPTSPPSLAPPTTGLPTSLIAEGMTCWAPDTSQCRYTLPPYQSTWYCICLSETYPYVESQHGNDINKDGDQADHCGYIDFTQGTWTTACAVSVQSDTAETTPCQVTPATCAYEAFFANAQ